MCPNLFDSEPVGSFCGLITKYTRKEVDVKTNGVVAVLLLAEGFEENSNLLGK